MFARYAYPPNLLGYCGPDDPGGIFEVAVGDAGASGSQVGDEFGARARAFDGAWAYLEIIAAAAGLADPLDERVVEAYWLGNDLLERVDPALFAHTARTKFAREVGAHWAALVPGGAQPSVPHHGFQVFTVYPWVPLLGRGDTALSVLDRCRIRWARVDSVAGDHIEVSCRPLTWDGRLLALGGAQAQRVRWAQDGRSLLGRPTVGDWVSLHWDWACEILLETQLEQLQRRTENQLATTNRAIAAHSPPH